jgi:hypothetical protein
VVSIQAVEPHPQRYQAFRIRKFRLWDRVGNNHFSREEYNKCINVTVVIEFLKGGDSY